MTSSVWRISHLALAVVAFLFLILASVTGVILAGDAIVQKTTHHYKAKDFNDITLAQSLPVLRKVFPEITQITVDKNQFVTLEGLDDEGNDIKAVIDPHTGKVLGKPIQKSEFINQVTALHRSLFLKETGRFVMGLVSFLLLLSTLSGILLIVKRQNGIRYFFSTINKDYFPQYFHVVSGRLLLIPVLIISLTGTVLFMIRFKLLPQNEPAPTAHQSKDAEKQVRPSSFSVFEETKLADTEKIEFPFDPDDPEDIFMIKMKDREIEVNQSNGKITKVTLYPYTERLSALNLDLHTGRTSIFWAFILGIASLNILAFIYTGFSITLRRRSTKIKNKYKPEEAKIILLVGSENGSTTGFADKIHQQLLDSGYLSFLTMMNQYSKFPKAEHILVFASTYGLGDAPNNASKFLSLIEKYPQDQKVKVSVVGFGSQAYSDFCGFAKKVDTELRKKDWAFPVLDLFTVNERSPEHFANWAKEWSSETGISLKTTPAVYDQKPKDLQKMKVLEKTPISESEHTFLLTLKPKTRRGFTSGDLLAVYPVNDYRERLYSIGKKEGNIQLKVKMYPNGLGSEYLNNLTEGSIIKARIVENKSFHLPKKAKKVVMIANGTGIAPFLGMIHENKKKTECHLYCGFRNETEMIKKHQAFAEDQISKQKLRSFHIAFSREQNHCYVMDLIERDADFFIELLENDGVIMICGSLIMQKDVEKILDKILLKKNKKGLEVYKTNGQILTDCY